MFYCEPCRKAKDWPKAMAMSRGKCEICQHGAYCYDTPSRNLPLPPKPTPVQEAVHLLNALTADQRKDVFRSYCVHCGDTDPMCRCWDDS
jgi:hypothetical protein